MSRYYIPDCLSPLHAELHQITVPDAAQKRWMAGLPFRAEDPREGLHPPSEPIELVTEEGLGDERIYAELYWQPIPLLSRRLVRALRDAGVDNLQTYETHLVTRRGDDPPPVDHYLAVNIVGLIAAADLARSVTNPDLHETMTSMDFHSLAIDPHAAKDVLLFRLAENVSAVLVHETVKARVEAAGIDGLTWFAPEEWAG